MKSLWFCTFQTNVASQTSPYSLYPTLAGSKVIQPWNGPWVKTRVSTLDATDDNTTVLSRSIWVNSDDLKFADLKFTEIHGYFEIQKALRSIIDLPRFHDSMDTNL